MFMIRWLHAAPTEKGAQLYPVYWWTTERAAQGLKLLHIAASTSKGAALRTAVGAEFAEFEL